MKVIGSFSDPSMLAKNPVTFALKSPGKEMIVTYRTEDEKYDVSIDGTWFADIPKAPTEPREMPRIMRIRKETREDRKALTTSFSMMVDGE